VTDSLFFLLFFCKLDFGMDEVEREHRLKDLCQTCWQLFLEKLHEETNDFMMSARMRSR
jgi:hypothetical protein